MAIFFRSTPSMNTELNKALSDALATDPATVSNPQAVVEASVQQIQQQTAARFSWSRLIVAILLLGALLGAAIYTGSHQDNLKQLYEVLLHAFELILGAIVGLITGEAVSRQ